jgi:hypothetical protein
MKMSKKSVSDDLVKIYARVDALAARYRAEVLVPLCQKYSLSYYASNGDVSFCLPSGRWLAENDAREADMPALVSAFEVLGLVVGRDKNDLFGLHVQNVFYPSLRGKKVGA